MLSQKLNKNRFAGRFYFTLLIVIMLYMCTTQSTFPHVPLLQTCFRYDQHVVCAKQWPKQMKKYDIANLTWLLPSDQFEVLIFNLLVNFLLFYGSTHSHSHTQIMIEVDDLGCFPFASKFVEMFTKINKEHKKWFCYSFAFYKFIVWVRSLRMSEKNRIFYSISNLCPKKFFFSF